MGVASSRAKTVAFSDPYVEIPCSFLVPKGKQSSKSGILIEVGVFLLQKLRYLGHLWTDLANNFGDLLP